jgi:hypothetical protein
MVTLNGTKGTPKYLFAAKFADGKIIEQNTEDRSIVNPQCSAFNDVLEEIKVNPLDQFAITDSEQVWLVDLKDGKFTVNGSSFYLHETDKPYYNRRLIFFHRHWTNMLIAEEYDRQYCLGWHGNVEPSIESHNEEFKLFIR